MSTARSELILRLAAVCALVGLALIAWSILDPRPLPILVGLSIGQGVGTLSFLGFLVVVAADLRVKRQVQHQGVSDDAGDAGKPPPNA